MYIPVEMFMMKDMGLKSLDLLIYALVYSFSSAGKIMFISETKLGEIMGYQRESICRAIGRLVQQELIRPVADPRAKNGAKAYTINNDKVCPEITPRCDNSSQEQVTMDHTLMCASVTGTCDDESRNNKETEKTYKGDIVPLPNYLSNDEEFRTLWQCLLQSSRWSCRTPEMLAESVKVLNGWPLEVAREMLRYTIEGDYPRIYKPNEEVLAKARKASCDDSSHLTRKPEKTDDAVIGEVIDLVPKELRQFAYGREMGRRALRLVDVEGVVTICLPAELRDWFEEHKPELLLIAKGWAGAEFKTLIPHSN